MLAVIGNLAQSDVLTQIRDTLAASGQTVRISEHVKDLFPAPCLVVVLDGWGKTRLPEAAVNLRSLLPWTPILAILTVHVHGAGVPKAGLSDWITWPVAGEQLLARVHGALSAAQPIDTAAIVVHPGSLAVHCNDVQMTLTRAEFRLMMELLKSQNQWSSSKRLRECIAGERRLGLTPVAERIHAIRAKLRHEAWRLRSHRTLGYFFDVSQGASVTRGR